MVVISPSAGKQAYIRLFVGRDRCVADIYTDVRQSRDEGMLLSIIVLVYEKINGQPAYIAWRRNSYYRALKLR